MIVYKVVEKETRNCSNLGIWKSPMNTGCQTEREIIKIEKFIEDHPEFFPKYLKGTIINKAPETPGIFTFKEHKDARAFTKSEDFQDAIIIKVEGIGSPNKHASIILGCAANPMRLGSITDLDFCEAPEGSITFESVEVLE